MSRAVVIALCIVAGCVDPSPDYSSTHFACDDTHGCPGEQMCTANVCGGPLGPGPYLLLLHVDQSITLKIGGTVTAEHSPLQLALQGDGPLQSWMIEPVAGTTGSHLEPVVSTLCLDLDTGDNQNGLQLQQLDCGDSTALSQLFQFLPIGTSYQIKNASTGRCIDSGGTLTDGTPAEEWTCTPSFEHQLWDLTKV